MLSALVFVDTNILVYAHDPTAVDKHRVAQEKVISLWQSEARPIISVQVLQELYVNLLRKKLSAEACREIVKDYMQWTVVPNDVRVLSEGLRIVERYQVSLWDGLIIAAALSVCADEVWSEDLNDGQDYGGVRVVNPLR